MVAEMNRTNYEVRDASGALVAIHVREDQPDGKKSIFWVGSDGRKGLGGQSPDSLPLYGIERLDKRPRVVIAEGEKAAQALIDAGIPAVGTVTGASSVPSRASLSELNGRDIVLWPDADAVGQEHMRKIAANLRGIAASVRWVNWPEGVDGDDAFDCLARFGVERTLQLIDSAGPVTDAGMRFERIGLGYRAIFRIGQVTMTLERIKSRSGQVHGELAVRSNDPFAPEDGHLLQSDFNVSSLTSRKTTGEWLGRRAPKVEADWQSMLEEFCRRVLAAEREGLPIVSVGSQPQREAAPYLVYPAVPLNRATILFGPGGSGKSFLAAGLAVSVSTGTTVVAGWTPNRPGKVLVLDWEADAEEWNDRIAMVARGCGVEAPAIAYRSCVAPLTEQVEEVARYVLDNMIDLVIVDSVGMASPGGREGTDANEATIRLFQAIRVLKTSVLLIDHVSKAGNEKESGAGNPYGSIFKVNLARMTWELRREDSTEEDGEDGHLLLVNRKANSGPRRAPIGLRIEYGEDTVRFVREDIVDGLQRSVPASTKVFNHLARNGWSTVEEVVEATGVDRDTVRQYLNRDARAGKYVKDATGRFGLAYRQKKATDGDL